MEAPDIAALLTQIGLRNARELKLLIQDSDNIPSIAAKFEALYRDIPMSKEVLSLLFDNYPFVPESTKDLVAILKKTKHIFQFFKESSTEVDIKEFEAGLKFTYKFVYKVLYNSPEDVFQDGFISELKADPKKKDSLKKHFQKNRYHFLIMLRVIIDQGYMLWGEGIANFDPLFRDRLEIYHLNEELMEELLSITQKEEISFFLAAYLYLFFVIPRSAK